MNNRRQAALIFGTLSVLIFGGMVFIGLKDRCLYVSQSECTFLWILFILATIGGILLVETLSKNQKKNGDQVNTHFNMSKTQMGTRSIFRLIFSMILLGLPILFQGAYIATVGGLLIGPSLDIIYRGLTNNFPIDPENNNLK